jgi:DNA-binding CsgD family transcriptional regulator
MAASRQIDQALVELRRLARIARRHPARAGEAALLLARVVGSSRTLAIEQRVGGIAFRLEIVDAGVPCSLTCVLHEGGIAAALTSCEREVATLLCEGRTLAQIAHLRGVSINTVKSQVRQVFRKLDVETRVALVRRLAV